MFFLLLADSNIFKTEVAHHVVAAPILSKFFIEKTSTKNDVLEMEKTNEGLSSCRLQPGKRVGRNVLLDNSNRITSKNKRDYLAIQIELL